MITVSEKMHPIYEFSAEEGMLVGISSGSLLRCVESGENACKGHVVVTIFAIKANII